MTEIYIFSKDKKNIFNSWKKQTNDDAQIHVTSDERISYIPNISKYTPIIMELTDQNKALLAVTTANSPQQAFRLAILKGFVNFEQAEHLAKDVDRISSFQTLKRLQKKERRLGS